MLGVALLVAFAAERVRIPSAVLLVAAGSIAGTVWHLRPPFDFTQALLFVFLPPLMFEAAWALDASLLRATWRQILFLAVPGTLLTAFGIAGGLAAVSLLPFSAALVFGALVSATDPVAVVAVFRSVRVPPRLATIVEAESLANDGIAVVLYGAALAAALGSTTLWSSSALAGVYEIVVGIAVGTICALPCWRLLFFTRDSNLEIIATLVLAYSAYLIALEAHASGIFASVAAAITLRALIYRKDAIIGHREAAAFWSAIASIANAVVFFATGLLIEPQRLLHEPILAAACVGLALLVRGALSLVSVRTRAERIVVFFAGMRGALPLALALALPRELPYRAEIVDAVYATVLFTIVVAGIPLGPIAARLFGENSKA